MPEVDPTIEYVPIEIDGKTYRMCFDLGSLAKAEAEINRNGGDMNVLRGIELEKLKMNEVLILFACSLSRAHPELKREDVSALENRQSAKILNVIYGAVAQALVKSYGLDDFALEKKAEASESQTSEAEKNSGSICGASPATT